MRWSLRLGKVCASTLLLLTLVSISNATPMEPTPDPSYRDLRTGYIQTWYIYNDQMTNGILDPGDQAVECFDNWWTTVSAHTQHNYNWGPYGNGPFYYDPTSQDMPSGPMNFASKTNSSDNFWLNQETNTIAFYMTYSQRDNNDFATFYQGAGYTPDQQAMLEGRDMERNGWALGWLTNAIVKQDGQYVYDGTPGGGVKMDIFVHDGQGTYMVDFGADGVGISRSNPQVATSNDISHLAGYSFTGNPDNTQWHPPTFDQADGSYRSDSPTNTAYKNVLGLTDAQFDEIVDSMEVREVDSDALPAAETVSSRTPAVIEATLTDHNGDPYVYQDAFLDRSQFAVSTNDGGVIAGLSGWDEYDPELNNWGDQQVIRIDISRETLLEAEGVVGNIDKIVFYDFGCDSSTQTSPRQIVLNVDDGGNIYLDDGEGGRIYFPENRIYIARVQIVPEPTTMALLAGGATCLILTRRRYHV